MVRVRLYLNDGEVSGLLILILEEGGTKGWIKSKAISSACICQSTVCLCVVYVGHFSLFAMVLIGDFTFIFNIF